jgi:hypothetical protein
MTGAKVGKTEKKKKEGHDGKHESPCKITLVPSQVKASPLTAGLWPGPLSMEILVLSSTSDLVIYEK